MVPTATAIAVISLAFEPDESTFHALRVINLAWGLFLVGLMGICNASPEFNRCFSSFYIAFAVKRDAMGSIEKI